MSTSIDIASLRYKVKDLQDNSLTSADIANFPVRSEVSGAITGSIVNFPTRTEVTGAITSSLNSYLTTSAISSSFARLNFNNSYTGSQFILGAVSASILSASNGKIGDFSGVVTALTGVLSSVSPSTSGNILVSDGIKWDSFSFDSMVGGRALWSKPYVADPRDSEFENLTGWTIGSGSSATAIDAYSGFSSGGFRYSITLRPSWVLFQSPGDSVGYFPIHKAISPATNEFFWMRAISNKKVAFNSSTNNDATLGLVLSSGSAPDLANRITLYLVEADAGTLDIQFDRVESSVLFTAATVSHGDHAAYEYIGIQKIGTTYHAWVANPSGQWRWIASLTSTLNINRIGVLIGNVTTTSPGNVIVGVDFIRFKSGIVVPP